STLNTVFDTPGNKEIVLTAGIGVCEDVVTKSVVARPHPAEIEMTQDSICNGYFGNVRLLGPFDNNTEYDWYNMRNELLLENSRTFTTPNRLNRTTQYYVQGTNQFGCEGPTRVFEILVYPEQARDFSFSPETVEVPNAIVTFEADIESQDAVNDILWQLGNREVADSEPVVVHQYDEPGTYDIALQVTDTNGCASTVLKENILEVTESVVSAIPTAFSPNGDGLNDELIIDLQNIADASFMIFDRQGRKRFTSDDRLIVWDGKSEDGTALPEGVYVYLLEYTAYNGTAKSLTGSITIIR
ncbi:MAG: gliding motility-associated C-terminal domain-containing protein, partial [Bacteroidota bacterium]